MTNPSFFYKIEFILFYSIFLDKMNKQVYIWMSLSLSELTSIIFHIQLTHLGS